MTNAKPDGAQGGATDEAIGWFVRLQDPSASVESWRAFEAWLQRSDANRQAYDRLEILWVDLESVNDVAVARLGRAGALTRRGALWASGAMAAGLVAAALGVGLWPAPATTYRTAPGEIRQIRLADGSRVQLNADSEIRVRLGPGQRRVEMGAAEAIFDVTHDPRRPFLIAVGDRQVRVVGTQFNLRNRDGRIALTVRRGVVEVRAADAPDAAPTQVTVGQQLIHKIGDAGSHVEATAADAAFAWTSGQLIYREQPLSDVAGDLSRRFGVPVRFADPATAQLRFTGVLVTDDEPDVLRRLEAFVPVVAERSGGAIVLRRRGG